VVVTLNYTTVPRIISALPLLNDATQVTSADLATFAEDAEAIVDAKIAVRYSVPVAGPPAILTTIAGDLAIYRVLALRLFTSEAMNDSPWPGRYKEAMVLLDQIAAGDMALVSSGEVLIGAETVVGEIWSSTSGYVPTFSELPSHEQQVDTDKLDALRDMQP
jgi:phage gp36-like protein